MVVNGFLYLLATMNHDFVVFTDSQPIYMQPLFSPKASWAKRRLHGDGSGNDSRGAEIGPRPDLAPSTLLSLPRLGAGTL